MKQLWLFRKIIFVDWQGVASNDPFLLSVLENKKHPLNQQLERKFSKIFSNKEIVDRWMKGLVSSQEIIQEMHVQLDKRFNIDFLERRIVADCLRMRVNFEVFRMLSEMQPLIPIILATDNMDCFVNAFYEAKRKRRANGRNGNGKAVGISDWTKICDEIICSSNVGTLKSEDPISFFGSTLSNYGLDFTDALLIDDRQDNCDAFIKCGGDAIRWKIGEGGIDNLSKQVGSWFE